MFSKNQLLVANNNWCNVNFNTVVHSHHYFCFSFWLPPLLQFLRFHHRFTITCFFSWHFFTIALPLLVFSVETFLHRFTITSFFSLSFSPSFYHYFFFYHYFTQKVVVVFFVRKSTKPTFLKLLCCQQTKLKKKVSTLLCHTCSKTNKMHQVGKKLTKVVGKRTHFSFFFF